MAEQKLIEFWMCLSCLKMNKIIADSYSDNPTCKACGGIKMKLAKTLPYAEVITAQTTLFGNRVQP